VDAGEGIGPQIIKAGIIDGPGNRALGVIRASNAEEAANAVKLYKDNGFEQIKIYSSITPAVVKAITTEAHRLGMTVTGHIPQGMTIFQGIDSGMDQVNHISYVYGVLKVNKDRSINWDDTTNTAILKRLAEKKVVIDPTLSIYELIFRNTNEDVLAIEPGYNTLPEPLQVLFKSIGMPVAQAIAMKPYFTSLLTLIKKMKENGVTFVAGTDMGFPGYSVAREVELYVSAGLTPLEAIQTATIIPARVMKKDNSYGTITVEKKADLILIVGNPLVNIRDIRNVVSVIKNGVVYDPVALHKMAGFQIK
jgi:imidazolonepropionase-like amidohydrolase